MRNRSYVIKIRGLFEGQNQPLFEDSLFSYYDGITTIESPVLDQSALHGLLNRIRDLNLELISLEQGETNDKSTGFSSSCYAPRIC